MSDWGTLSKKELLELLESYDDEKHIVFKVNLKQGVVGFWDVKKDEINSDTDKLVLMSPALDKWYAEDIQELTENNEQLKSELSRYKEVNRLDIWKSSYSSEDALITELQNKCNKKQEHIVVLENKIRRMREAIHKLEWLASHRNADLQRENYQLKQQIQQLQYWNKCLAEKRHQELSYKHYTDSKSEKELKELLEPKLFNCSDR